MERTTLQRALEHADLTSAQADAYLTLLKHGRLSATDVANRSTVSTSQVYSTLRSLESMGFVDTIEQDTLHAEPREPTEIFAHLRDRSTLLTDAADELVERWEQPAVNSYRVSVVKNSDTVIERVRNRLSETSHGVEMALTIDQLESLAPDLRATIERGVFVRVSVYEGHRVGKRCHEAGLLDQSLELRVVTIPGPFLAVLDRHHTYFMPNSRAPETYGILINDEILSLINHWYFQTCLWSMYEPIESTRRVSPTYISLEEFIRDVAPLYHDGATVTVQIDAIDIETERERTVTGTISGLFYPGLLDGVSQPSLEELSTYSTVFLDTGQDRLAVGSWGAVFEDIEAQKIILKDVRLDER